MRLLPLFLAVTVAVVSSSAIPLDRVVVSKTLNGRDVNVTDADLENFKYFAEYSGSAYCNNDAEAGAVVTCTENVCPTLTSNGAKVLLSLNGDTATNIEGYVAVDSVGELIVLSLRGSSSVRNWIADLLFLFSSCGDIVSGCKVHTGFYQAWKDIQDDVMTTVAAAHAENPTYKVVATGHSLGAAVATLAGVYLRNAGIPTDIYTYGSPRVGNQAFVEFTSGQAGAEYRLTHLNDPVPRLPPVFLGYRHTTPEYWLSTGQADTVDYSVSDITICEGYANLNCVASASSINVDAHLYYLLPISACSSSGLTFRADTSEATITDEQLQELLDAYAQRDREYLELLEGENTAS